MFFILESFAFKIWSGGEMVLGVRYIYIEVGETVFRWGVGYVVATIVFIVYMIVLVCIIQKDCLVLFCFYSTICKSLCWCSLTNVEVYKGEINSSRMIMRC